MSGTLLLVCQEELHAQLAMRVFRAQGVEVLRVSTPEEVGGALEADPAIRVVLCDWRLPPTVGSDWVQSWKSIEPLRSIHFVLLSDRLPTPHETESIFQKGVADIWIRPVPDYLMAPRLRVWLSVESGVEGSSGGSPTSEYVDPVTLLIGCRIFLEHGEGMFAGSRRLGTYVGFLAVAISNMAVVSARLGEGGRRETSVFLANELRATKRREDLLGRWDADVFVLASYFPKGESVEAFGRRILGALQNAKFPHAEKVGPLRFTVSGAWGPSRDYVMARDALEAVVAQARTTGS